jgi:hypothetical protein
MQHLEDSGTPVLYIGRTVLKVYVVDTTSRYGVIPEEWSIRRQLLL